MTKDQKAFIDLLCTKYGIDQTAWKNETNTQNILLMLVDLLFANVRAHQSQIKALQDRLKTNS